jgi:sRNA-binding carbon storage regulator CsrA
MTTLSTAVDAPDRPHDPSTSRLVLKRSVGEGFSLGDDWRFDVLDLTARSVTLVVTGASRTVRWQVEVDDALQVAIDNTLVCSRDSPAAFASVEVRVLRVTTSRATLLVHADRSFKITRRDLAPAHATAA